MIKHLTATLLSGLLAGSVHAADNQAGKIALGKLIFNDSKLSEPAGQSCSSCHRAEAFYSDPGNMISPGADPSLFGNRNAPSLAYVKFNPALYWDDSEEHWVGGLFLDGRARDLAEQVRGPFLNPLEMGNRDAAELVSKVRSASYAPLLQQLYGEQVWQNPETTMDAISDAVVAYESGPEFALFSSKFDYYLQGKVALTALEAQGLELFEAEDKGNCAACHPSQKGSTGELPLLTDFTYDNLGLPGATTLPFLQMAEEFNPAGRQYIDQGLADNPYIHNAHQEPGKFKVPSLRNIAQTGPYMHNGMFETLEEVVNFYNKRDIASTWGKPEVTATVNSEELGDLGLSDSENEALIAFMQTLTDGYAIKPQ